MLKMHEIRELIKLVDQSTISTFDYEFEGLKVSIKKDELRGQTQAVQGQEIVDKVQAAPAPVAPAEVKPTPAVAPQPTVAETKPTESAPAAEDTSHLHKIESPMVGTFYRAPSPDADPYVDKGDKVTETTVVCIVEAMKLMNEIEAEVKGEIVEVLVENGQLVEYGQPLFLVKPE